MNREMYNQIIGKKCTLSTILKVIDKQAEDKSWRYDSEYDYETKNRFLNLIQYFAGKDCLLELYGKLDKELVGGVPSGFEIEKFTGKNKVNAKKYLEVFVKIFNDYFEVSEEEIDTSYHGSPDWEETGYFEIGGVLPYNISEKVNEIFDKNFEEDEKVVLKAVKEFRKQQKLAKEQEVKEKMTTKKQVEKEKKDNEDYELLEAIEF